VPVPFQPVGVISHRQNVAVLVGLLLVKVPCTADADVTVPYPSISIEVKEDLALVPLTTK